MVQAQSATGCIMENVNSLEGSKLQTATFGVYKVAPITNKACET